MVKKLTLIEEINIARDFENNPENLIEIREHAFTRCPFPELEVPKNAVYPDNYYSFYDKKTEDDLCF